MEAGMEDEVQRAVAAFRRVRGVTVAALERVPPDRLDWAPAAGIYTCGGLGRHVAAVPPFYLEVMRGRRTRFSEPPTEQAPDLPAILGLLRDSCSQWEEFLAHASAEELASGFSASRPRIGPAPDPRPDREVFLKA
jgi:hypothetical protein